MEKRVIHTPLAPAAIGPYSQAIATGGLIFTSGQIGLDPGTGEIVEGGFEAQVERSFSNLKAVIEAAGSDLSRVVKLTLFLTDLAQFGQVNAAMQALFAQPYPARSTVGVASLPRGALFEVEAVVLS